MFLFKPCIWNVKETDTIVQHIWAENGISCAYAIDQNLPPFKAKCADPSNLKQWTRFEFVTNKQSFFTKVIRVRGLHEHFLRHFLQIKIKKDQKYFDGINLSKIIEY